MGRRLTSQRVRMWAFTLGLLAWGLVVFVGDVVLVTWRGALGWASVVTLVGGALVGVAVFVLCQRRRR